MKKLFLVFALLVGLSAGCAQQPPQSSQNIQQEEESTFDPFIVYHNKGTRENHFVPSGFMPNGNCLEFNDAWQQDCLEGSSSCIKVVYDIECSKKDQQWAGIFWLNPANNWGSKKGGFNLEGATKLTFWAKGKNGGERIEEFNIGGITGNYPDSDSAMIGPVILTNEWREYSIDLRGKDLSYISGGFSWTTNAKVNSQEKCEFYLDNIQYE